MNQKHILTLFLLALALTACAQPTTAVVQPSPTSLPPTVTPAPTPTPRPLTVMTHDSFAVSESVVAAFEAQYNAKVQFLKAGDTGTALNKAILSKDAPLADVFYGVDNTFLSRALDEGIFEPYASPLVADIPAYLLLDSQFRALPVDYADVCLNYDKAYFTGTVTSTVTAPPQTLEDLLLPEYKGLLVVENPATSSPGLAFLLATIGHFGEEGYLDYWQGLVDNEVTVVNDWNTAYYTEFTRSGGTRPIVVSYNSSPVFELIYADPPVDEPPTAAIVSDETCFRQIELVGILKGTPRRDLAEKWVDFMLSIAFQEDMPLQMAVFPVNKKAQIGDQFIQFLAVPQMPAFIRPADIAEKRQAWIEDWTDVVLR